MCSDVLYSMLIASWLSPNGDTTGCRLLMDKWTHQLNSRLEDKGYSNRDRWTELSQHSKGAYGPFQYKEHISRYPIMNIRWTLYSGNLYTGKKASYYQIGSLMYDINGLVIPFLHKPIDIILPTDVVPVPSQWHLQQHTDICCSVVYALNISTPFRVMYILYNVQYQTHVVNIRNTGSHPCSLSKYLTRPIYNLNRFLVHKTFIIIEVSQPILLSPAVIAAMLISPIRSLIKIQGKGTHVCLEQAGRAWWLLMF